MMSLSSRDILPILMILASVGSLFGVVQPRYKTIQALKVEKQGYVDTLDKANEARIMRETLLAEYNSVAPEDWKKLGKMIPRKANGVQLARDLDGLAKVFGIKLNKFSFSEEAAATSVAVPNAPLPVPISAASAGSQPGEGTEVVHIPSAPLPQVRKLKLLFDFEATYPDFMRFLRELEKNLELSDVRSLSLSRAASKDVVPANGKIPPSTSPSPNVYAIRFAIDTYWIQ